MKGKKRELGGTAIGIFGGAVVGALVGASMGIAMFGGAVAGTTPLAILLAIIGGLVGNRIGLFLDGRKESPCGCRRSGCACLDSAPDGAVGCLRA